MAQTTPPPLADRATDIGLICGFVLRPGAQPERIADADLDAAVATAGGTLWLHFNLANNRARDWISRFETVPARVRDILLGADGHVRFEVVDDAIAGVLSDFGVHPDAGEEESLEEFRAAIGPSYVVTARRHAVKSPDRLRRELGSGTGVEGAVALFDRMIRIFADEVRQLIQTKSDLVDDIEDRILVGRGDDLGERIGPLRRSLVQLRRRLNAERHALQRILPHLPAWRSDADAALLRQTHELLELIAQDLDLVSERARLLQEEFAAKLSETTSRDLFFLSVLTAVILPVNLITGVFGMNVGGLPGVGRDDAFLWVIGGMAVTVAATVFFLRRRRLF